MDVCVLPVRFHFNGKFVRKSSRLFYDEGTQAMSYIDRDKLSLPEVIGHLHDHCNVKEGTMLHWLFPGKDMSTGLRALVDDTVCQFMSDSIPEDGVADVYDENHDHDAIEEASEYEEEMEDNSMGDEIEDEDLQPLSIAWKSESKQQANGVEKSDSDSDYMPGDSCNSGDDDEAAQIHRKFKDFKKKVKRGEATSLDDVIYEGVAFRRQTRQEDEDDGNCTPYVDKYEVKHFDNRFTVDLVSKTCSCRYWQLSGLPCCHAISCILFKTNCLDEYVADCYSVHHFKQTYSHCLNPVEGMNSWPSSDREPLGAPGYVKMPGRPKTERRREPTEGRKATKMAKTGTIIRCSKCHLPGHNKSTCTNISGAGPSQPEGNTHATLNLEGGGSSQPIQSQASKRGNSNAICVLPNTQKSTTSGTKRSNLSQSTQSQSISSKKAKTSGSKNIIKSSARARVSTIPSGSATLNLQARVPTSNVNSSVHIQLTGGTASVHVSAQEPAKSKPTPKRSATTPLLMLGPWESNKL